MPSRTKVPLAYAIAAAVFLLAWFSRLYAASPVVAEADVSIWEMHRWSPYIVGIGIGVLSWIAFLISDKPIGVSTAYAKTAGMLEMKFRGKDKVKSMAYFQEYKPGVGWEWMLVVGLLLGALLSALLSGDFELSLVPVAWSYNLGTGMATRLPVALVGGVLMGIGARWADGCTSGHGISGTLQLVVSSWVAVICFFIGGVVTAFALYGAS